MDGLLNPAAGRDQGDPSSRPVGLYATVASVSGSTVRVVIPEFSRTRPTDPVRYIAPAGTPVVGDACVVVFDDYGNPWAMFEGVPPAGGGGGALRFSQTIGDGVSTTITVTHNLGTRDVAVSVREAATPFEVVGATVRAATTNTVTVGFAVAPTTNQYRVTVLA
jgi:hypothetical protein